MAKIKSIFNKEFSVLASILSVVIISIIIGLGFHLVLAAPWTGPTANPPNNNVEPPLSTAGGTITGNLTIEGDFYPERIGPQYSTWSGVGDGGSAIINDNNVYRALMVVGSDQGQGYGRWVRLWDYLTVQGGLTVTGTFTSVGSTAKVANLNADLLDGLDSSALGGDATLAMQQQILGQVDNAYSACYVAECHDADPRRNWCSKSSLLNQDTQCPNPQSIGAPTYRSCISPFVEIGSYEVHRHDNGCDNITACGACTVDVFVCCLPR